MQYFLLPLILYICSELIGTLLIKKMKFNSFRFNGIVGFSFILACLYVLYFPLVALNVNFKVLLAVTLIFFLMLAIFIAINRKSIQLEANYKEITVVILLIGIQIYFASRNTVGSLWRYDTITYTNMITGSIYGETINSIDCYNGFGYGFLAGYSFQSFYKLASVLYYCINAFCNILHIDFFYYTQHVWMYTLLLYVFISEMVVNFIHEFKIKNIGVKILIILFFVLFMGNFYWNSEQAYLGNSFRMITTSYLLYYLYIYLKEKDNRYLWMLIIFNYANTACANSNSTLSLILVFFLWVVDENRKNVLKYHALSLYLPLMNCLFQAVGYNYIVATAVTALLVVVIVLEKQITIITDKLKLKTIFPILAAIALILLSYRVTGDLFSFDSFLNNWSGWSDMTWDYTDFSTVWRTIANVCYIILMAMAFIKYKNSCITKMLLLTALVFFNPFAAAIQEKYMLVYYRNYDIVINYFTLMAGFQFVDEYEKHILKYSLIGVLTVSSAYIGFKQLNYHPGIGNSLGDGFEKSSDYNCLLKMDNDTADALLFMKDYLVSNDIKDGKVISSIYQFRTEFPYMKTLYNRNKAFNQKEEDLELYKIFYPDDYYGDGKFSDVDYEHIQEYLEESDYMFVILDVNKIYYNKDKDVYYPLKYLLDEFYSPLYENETYSIYRIH